MTDTVNQPPNGNPPSYLVQAMMQQYMNNLNNPQGANAMQNQPAGTNTQAASGYGALGQIANTYTQQQMMKQMMQGYQQQQPNQAIDVSGIPANNQMLTMGSLGGQS